MRQGYTTGSCATAAAVAAATLLIKGTSLAVVTIQLPRGGAITIPIAAVGYVNGDSSAKVVQATVVKDAGDDPDVTHGLDIVARVKLSSQNTVLGGQGVGRVTLPGLQVPVGESAINPMPKHCILSNLALNFPEQAFEVVVEVPEGEQVAHRTLNPKLGIVGGISILGTTGIVRPMSDDAYKDSLVPQLDVIKALGYNSVILVPGGIGERQAVSLGFKDTYVAQMSNYVGHMAAAAAKRGFAKCLLVGHHSKLTKVAGGSLDTHNQRADGRRETLAAAYARFGGSSAGVAAILDSVNSEEALARVETEYRPRVYEYLAQRAARCVAEYAWRISGQHLEVGCIMLDLQGKILGYDPVGGLELKELETI